MHRQRRLDQSRCDQLDPSTTSFIVDRLSLRGVNTLGSIVFATPIRAHRPSQRVRQIFRCAPTLTVAACHEKLTSSWLLNDVTARESR